MIVPCNPYPRGMVSLTYLTAGTYGLVEQQPVGFDDGVAVISNGGFAGVN